MIERFPRGVDSDRLPSRQLMFDNAIAVFGLVPMFALMVKYHELGMHDEIGYCKAAMGRFKDGGKFLSICQKNREVLAGDSVVLVNDINVFDLSLTELGYYEQYDQRKLQFELNELIKFVNS